MVHTKYSLTHSQKKNKNIHCSQKRHGVTYIIIKNNFKQNTFRKACYFLNSELRTQKFVYSTLSFYKQTTIYLCIKTYLTF